MSAPADALFGALIGLVRACKNNVKTENTDAVLVSALALPDGADGAALRAALEAVRAEKRAVAPSCAECKNPCGATDDYDMACVDAADAEIREIKRGILAEARAAARALHASGADADCAPLYKGIEFVGYDVDAGMLRDALREARAFREACEAREACESMKGGQGVC